MEHTGLMDPIEDTTPSDWDRFHHWFPVVYFAFLLLSRQRPDSPLIAHLALNTPHDVPGFDNFDLWLQRQAFYQRLNAQGISFIVDHYEALRLELIVYGVLKCSFESEALLELKSFIEQNPHWATFGIERDFVIEVIDELCDGSGQNRSHL